MLRRTFLMLIGSSVSIAPWGAIAAVPRPPFKVIDVMPTFWKFWDTTIKESADKRVREFFNTETIQKRGLRRGSTLGTNART